MTARRPGKVHLLYFQPPEQNHLFETWPEWIANRIKPGASVTRYGREWVIGQTEFDNDIVTGRIGYRGSEGVAEIWDDDAQDFKPIAVPQGQAVPFAINLQTMRLAIQSRPMLKLNGLIGAIEAILSEDEFKWRIRSPREHMTFSDWRASVERVTKVRLRVIKPNPHYRDTPNLEALLEQAEAEVATLEIEAVGGIDTDSTFIVESQEHIDAGYGEGVYRGVVSEGHESVYNTKLETEENYEEYDVTFEGEVPHDSLRSALNDQ